MYGTHLPDGTSQAIFALWGAAATNAFNARQSEQTALTATQYTARDIEKSRAHRRARLYHANSARLFDDEPAARTIMRICEIQRLIQSRSDERLEIDPH